MVEDAWLSGGGSVGRRRESTPHLPRSRPEEATSGEQPSLDAAQEAAGRAAGPQAAGEHTVPRPKSAGECFC